MRNVHGTESYRKMPSPDGGFGRDLQLPTCYMGPKQSPEGTRRIWAKWDGHIRWRCQADTWCGSGEWNLSLALHCWPLHPSSLPSSLTALGGQPGHWRQPPTLDLPDGGDCPREEGPKPGECSALVGLSLNLKHAVQPHDAQPCRVISWDQGRVERKVWLCLRRHPVRPPRAGSLVCPCVMAGVCPGCHFTPGTAWVRSWSWWSLLLLCPHTCTLGLLCLFCCLLLALDERGTHD